MSAYDYLLDRVRESQERERAAKMEADRCQQLAALEAEIGRAVIGKTILQKMAVDMAWDGEMDAARLTGDQSDKYHDELPHLIARYRKLHAEGAEAEAATERQEGER